MFKLFKFACASKLFAQIKFNEINVYTTWEKNTHEWASLLLNFIKNIFWLLISSIAFYFAAIFNLKIHYHRKCIVAKILFLHHFIGEKNITIKHQTLLSV